MTSARPFLGILCCLLLSARFAAAQQDGRAAMAVVQAAVNTELHEDSVDHSAWRYQDHDVTPEKNTVAQVIQTPQGTLKRVFLSGGSPLSGEAEQQEIARIQKFVNSPSQQARRRRDSDHDDAQARELLTMLPNAFLWQIVAENAEAVKLQYKPNPAFAPPDMQARVMSTMAGEMIVSKPDHRIVSLRGKLSRDVDIGFGILGKLDAGGTFDIERRQIAPGYWQITETHVHIGGRALLFKTIGQEEDEEMTDWSPSTAPDLRTAEEQLLGMHGLPAKP